MFLLCLFLVWIVGLVASQEETTTRRSNFLNRKTVNRNNRTKPKPRTTTPAPAEDDEEIPTSPHCPEPDGFFADSEQCDKYYACRYGKHRWDQTCAVFILSWRYFNLLQWHWTAQRNPFLAKPIIVFFWLLLHCIFTYCHWQLERKMHPICFYKYWKLTTHTHTFHTPYIDYFCQWIEMQLNICFTATVGWQKNSAPMAWFSTITALIRKNAIYHTILTVHNDPNYVSIICPRATYYFHNETK